MRNAEACLRSRTRLENDGFIGIPVEISVLHAAERGDVKPGIGGTPVILYVVNANIVRAGTATDEEILRSMLERGWAVLILDFLGDERAACPALDWSVQALRARVRRGEFLPGDVFPEGDYAETFVAPSGCDVSPEHCFWSFDRHGADGTAEKIVEVWNNDFRGVFGDRVIPWTDAAGRRKPVQPGHDGSLPVWLNDDGEPDENGSRIRIRHTLAETLGDCVRSDGSPLRLDLHMHIIYPVRPEKPVPVMCLAGSGEHTVSCSATENRPQLNGFAFRGYAAVMYDYGYTPMAWGDHYGYFDGNGCPGRVTGDNVTYSMQFYNDKKINTAAMRYLRYLAASDGRFRFDCGAIGVFGNSKGGWMTYLGEAHPERLQEARCIPGHHGETRFDNGKTADGGGLRGGEPQPWLTWNGAELDSSANFLYPSCGGSSEYITRGHAPMYVTANIGCPSFHRNSNKMANLCRIYDVPTLFLEAGVGHMLACGPDRRHGADTYQALFDFAGFFLKGEPVKALFTEPAAGAENVCVYAPVTVQFTGTVSAAEAKRITVKSADGKTVDGGWTSRFGGTEWSFRPSGRLDYGTEYTVEIPDGLTGENGMPAAGRKASFSTERGRALPVGPAESVPVSDGEGVGLRIPPAEGRCFLRFRADNDAANAVRALSADGALLAAVRLRGAGGYEAEVPAGAELTLKTEKPAAVKTVYRTDPSALPEGVVTGPTARWEPGTAPDGTPAMKLARIVPSEKYINDGFYENTEVFENETRVYANGAWLGEITDADYGRKFSIRMRLFDTVSRRVRIELTGCTDRDTDTADYERNLYNADTRAGEWTEFAFDYAVYDPKHGEAGRRVKTLQLRCPSTGDLDAPLWLGGITVTETVTDAVLSGVHLFVPEGEREAPAFQPLG